MSVNCFVKGNTDLWDPLSWKWSGGSGGSIHLDLHFNYIAIIIIIILLISMGFLSVVMVTSTLQNVLSSSKIL